MSFDLSYIPPKARMMVAALAITGSTVVGIADYEGWFDTAKQPVPGDKWTYGHGTTVRPDGKPVQKGDKITPQRGLHVLNDDINRFANKLRGCITAPLFDYEWGAYLSLAYNIGTGAFCNKAKPGKPANLIDLINAQRYEEACARISEFNGVYRTQVGKDGKPVIRNGEVVKVKILVPGLVKRRAEERAICEGKVAGRP
jgi:lysozyme